MKKIVKLLDYEFVFVEEIQLERDNKNVIMEYKPQLRYKNKDGKSLHSCGDGSFCEFSMSAIKNTDSNVYAIFIDDELVYVGACQNLNKFNQYYGKISPSSCYTGGNFTFCNINKEIFNAAKSNKVISLYYYETNDDNRIKTRLIKHFHPKFNSN